MKRKKNTDQSETWSYKHDYPIEEVWNTDNTIARLIVPRLKAYRSLDKHGYPQGFTSMEEWNKVIDKMVYSFELNSFAPGPSTEQEREDFEDGFALFCKHYKNLWD